MAKVGRPAKNSGDKAERHRTQAREWYQRMSTSERKAYVQRRSKKKQAEGDARRYERNKGERDAYHREQAKAKKKAPPKPKTCQWPGCKSTDIEFHHQGVDKWLCPTHHAKARERQ